MSSHKSLVCQLSAKTILDVNLPPGKALQEVKLRNFIDKLICESGEDFPYTLSIKSLYKNSTAPAKKHKQSKKDNKSTRCSYKISLAPFDVDEKDDTVKDTCCDCRRERKRKHIVIVLYCPLYTKGSKISDLKQLNSRVIQPAAIEKKLDFRLVRCSFRDEDGEEIRLSDNDSLHCIGSKKQISCNQPYGSICFEITAIEPLPSDPPKFRKGDSDRCRNAWNSSVKCAEILSENIQSVLLKLLSESPEGADISNLDRCTRALALAGCELQKGNFIGSLN